VRAGLHRACEKTWVDLDRTLKSTVTFQNAAVMIASVGMAAGPGTRVLSDNDVRSLTGAFLEPDAHGAIVAQYDEVLQKRDGGALSATRYRAALESLIAEHPVFIDAYAHLGFALQEAGHPKRALEACLAGLKIGEDAFPSGYNGTIEWGWLENRPFLRAAHGTVLG
jgi:hypothetical protein